MQLSEGLTGLHVQGDSLSHPGAHLGYLLQHLMAFPFVQASYRMIVAFLKEASEKQAFQAIKAKLCIIISMHSIEYRYYKARLDLMRGELFIFHLLMEVSTVFHYNE